MSGCFLISHSLWQNDVTKIGEKLVVMTELRFDTAEQRCFHYYTLSRSTLCIELGMTRVSVKLYALIKLRQDQKNILLSI